MELIYKLSEIEKASNFVLKNVNRDIILIIGEVGTGKTTLIKEYCKLIGVEEIVNSPTYTLINEYQNKSSKIVHMDLYRVEDINEVNELGLFEYFDKNIVIIEWPEIILKMIDIKYSLINITFINEKERKLSIKNL
ncbi:tRNA (adenosine(37)-N6)-threonylcarbamoyltransferase complex ATPase subunit type 1 TsaE [Flavobacteriaceae bacterium]|nr:tRNA (adenosine(37)-N6)-threonylcarbamoyltransferase complex ATPase subunit type 1 TsaE [Flavobacteriaceae bacterium]